MHHDTGPSCVEHRGANPLHALSSDSIPEAVVCGGFGCVNETADALDWPGDKASRLCGLLTVQPRLGPKPPHTLPLAEIGFWNSS